MTNRYSSEFHAENAGFGLVLSTGNGNDIGEIALNELQLQEVMRIMLWDIHKKMSLFGQMKSRGILSELEEKGFVCDALLEAIAFFNIFYFSEQNFDITIPDDISSARDFMMSIEAPPFMFYEDLFRQVSQYINTGKLHPSKLHTLGEINTLIGKGKQALTHLLGNLIS